MNAEPESLTPAQFRAQYATELGTVQDAMTDAVISIQDKVSGDALAFGMAIVVGRVAGNCAAQRGESVESLFKRMEGLFNGIKVAAEREMQSRVFPQEGVSA